MYYIYNVKQLKNNQMKTLKSNSRIDNKNGFIFTTKEYQITVVKNLPFNFALIKIGNKVFSTDYANIK